VAQRILFDILQLSQIIGCVISAFHLKREDPRITCVDQLSKTKNTDNWSLDYLSFQRLHDTYNLKVDLFADANNKRLPMFASGFTTLMP